MDQVMFVIGMIFVLGFLAIIAKGLKLDGTHSSALLIDSLYGMDFKPDDKYIQQRRAAIEYLGDKYLLAKSVGRLHK